MQPNTFHNLPDGALVDELGALSAQLRELGEREKAIKDELKRRGVDRATGERFLCWIERDVAWLLNIDAVRAEMGTDWCAERSRVQGRTRVCTKPLNGECDA